MSSTKWDNRLLSLAAFVAQWSKDPSTQVGAVIADSRNRVVSLGFNGFPRGTPDSEIPLLDREERLRRTIHAEENALLFAERSVEGCTIYVTHPPCARCTAKLIQVGIVRIHAGVPTEEFNERWAQDVHSSITMITASGVIFD